MLGLPCGYVVILFFNVYVDMYVNHVLIVASHFA